jgi:hypothetical protein
VPGLWQQARLVVGKPGTTYKTAWLLAQKLRRSMIDPDRSLLEGVVEVDQTEIPFRTDDAFFDPRQAGKIIVAGAVEVVDRTTNRAKPRKLSAKYLDTRSGRVRLAAIPDNSAASLHAFIRANVRLGATLLTDGHGSYPGLSGYRHDPRTVGKMAGHVALPWIHRVFSLMKRWGLGIYHGLRDSISTRTSTSSPSDTTAASIGTSLETVLGIASRSEPASYWTIIGRENPRAAAPAASAGRRPSPRQTTRSRST